MINLFNLLGACLVAAISPANCNQQDKATLTNKRLAFTSSPSSVDASYLVNDDNNWGYVQLSTQFLSSGLMDYLNNHNSTYIYFSRFYGYSYTSNTSFYFEKIEDYYNSSYNAGAYFINELNQSDFDFTPQTWVGCLDELLIYSIVPQNTYSLFRFDRTYLRGGNPTFYVGYPYEVYQVVSDNLSTAFNGLYTKSYYGLNTYMSYPAYHYASAPTYNVYYGAYGQKVYTQVDDNSTFDSTQLSSAYTSRCTSSEQVIEEWGNLGLMDTFADFSLRITASDTQFNLSSLSNTAGSQFYNAVSTIKYVLKPLITSDQNTQTIYDSGYEDGEAVGYEAGKTAGYTLGYSEGFEYADNMDSTALSIFTGILDIGLVPINFFLAMLNFEVFGINISALVSGFLTIAIVIIIIRLITGKKDND